MISFTGARIIQLVSVVTMTAPSNDKANELSGGNNEVLKNIISPAADSNPGDQRPDPMF